MSAMTPKSLLLMAVAASLSLGQTRAAELFWDPGNNGNGSGDWSLSAVNWATGAGAVPPTSSWVNAPITDAQFLNTGIGGATATLLGSIVVGNITVGGAGNTIELRSNATVDTIDVQGGLSMAGNVELRRQSGTADVGFKFSGSGTSDGGTLILTKGGSSGGSLFVELAGSASVANTGGVTLNGSTNGNIGFISTGTGSIATSVANANTTNAKVILGATAGNTLSLNTGASVSSTPNGIQIGSTTALSTVPGIDSALTGTVALNGIGDLIGDTTAITLAGGTLLVGIDAADGGSETMGALTLAANSVIDFGNHANGYTLMFGLTNLNGFTLEVYNYTAGVDHLYFGDIDDSEWLVDPNLPPLPVSYSPYVTAFTQNIKFYTGPAGSPRDHSGAGWVLSGTFLQLDANDAPTPYSVNNGGLFSGEVVPVPEPTAVLSALLLLMAIAWKERHLFARVRAPRMAEPLAA